MCPLSLDDPASAEADLEACRDLLRAGSKSFAAASLLLPTRVRAPAAALYAFCRMADDAVDTTDDPEAIPKLQLRLARCYTGAPIDSPIDRAFSRMVRAHDLPRPLVDALIEGFAWDAEGRRYATLSDLRAYAARVAGTVGAMMTVLMGPRDEGTLARACDLGVAMQLTNIARDVGEDARNGRVYLPLDWLAEANVDVDAFLRDPRPSPALASVIERLLQHAEELYRRGDLGVPLLPRDCRAAIRSARSIYADIGRAIAASGHDAVSRRAVVSTSRKLWLVLRALVLPRASERAGDGRLAPPLPENAFLVRAAALPGAMPPRLLTGASS